MSLGIRLLDYRRSVRVLPPVDNSPSSIAGLIAWWNNGANGFWSDAGRTTPATANGAVYTRDDSSGNSRHASQATGANQGLYKVAAVGGEDSILYDGSNDYHSAGTAFAGFERTDPFTAFIVIKPTAVGAARGLIGKRSGSTGWFLQMSNTGNNSVRFGLLQDASHQASIDAATAMTGGGVYVVVARNSGAGNAAGLSVYINSATADTPSVAADTLTGTVVSAGANVCLGSRDGAVPFDGHIAEAGIYNVALSAPDLTTLVGGLKTKYGVA